MTVTPSNGLVGTPDFFSRTPLGLIHHPSKGQFISLYYSSCFGMLKIFFFLSFFIAHFLIVKNTYKNPYSLKAVNRDKKFWWNLVILVTFYMGIYMGGRQIFETSQEVHKRGG
jgi:uncharacterized membrane protein